MKRKINIAIASTTSRPGEVAGNLEQIAHYAKRAAGDGADILLTPELSASGYGPYPEVIATAEPAGDGPIFLETSRIAEANRIVVCAGFVEEYKEKRYLAHYIVYPGGNFAVQRKNRVMLTERPLDPSVELIPPDPAKPSEDPADPGQPRNPQFTFFDVNGFHCALVICADCGIEGLNEVLDRNGVEIMLVPTGAGGKREDRVTNAELLTEEGRGKYLKLLEKLFFPGTSVADCIKYRRALAAVNLCGFDGRGLYHAGHGSIITPMGEVAAFFHGLPNLDRQRPMYTHAAINMNEHV